MTKQSKATSKPDPAPYMTDRDRTPVAMEALESPLHVVVRPAAGIEVAWARVQAPHELTVLGYKPVRPEDVEQMMGGQYEPYDKNIGVYTEVDEALPTFRIGEHMLMYTSTRQKEARTRRELEKSRSLKPRSTDSDESEAEEEHESTIKKELTPTA